MSAGAPLEHPDGAVAGAGPLLRARGRRGDQPPLADRARARSRQGPHARGGRRLPRGAARVRRASSAATSTRPAASTRTSASSRSPTAATAACAPSAVSAGTPPTRPRALAARRAGLGRRVPRAPRLRSPRGELDVRAGSRRLAARPRGRPRLAPVGAAYVHEGGEPAWATIRPWRSTCVGCPRVETFRRLLPAPADAGLTAADLAAEVPARRPGTALRAAEHDRHRGRPRDDRGPHRADRQPRGLRAVRRAARAGRRRDGGRGDGPRRGHCPMERLAVVVSRSVHLPTDRGLLAAAGNRAWIVTPSPDAELPPCAGERQLPPRGRPRHCAAPSQGRAWRRVDRLRGRPRAQRDAAPAPASSTSCTS